MIAEDPETLDALREAMRHIFSERMAVEDDTLLNRLATDIEAAVAHGPADPTSLFEALDPSSWTGVLFSDAPLDPSSASFGLRVLGAMLAGDGGLDRLRRRNVDLEVLLESLFSRFRGLDAAVKCAALDLLRNSCSVPSLARSMRYEDVRDVGLRHICDPSMFVARSAQRFVARFVTRSDGVVPAAIVRWILSDLDGYPDRETEALASLNTLRLALEDGDRLPGDVTASELLGHCRRWGDAARPALLDVLLSVVGVGGEEELLRFSDDLLPELEATCAPLTTLKFLALLHDKLSPLGRRKAKDPLPYFVATLGAFCGDWRGAGTVFTEKLKALLDGAHGVVAPTFCYAASEMVRFARDQERKTGCDLIRTMVEWLRCALDASDGGRLDVRCRAALLDALAALSRERVSEGPWLVSSLLRLFADRSTVEVIKEGLALRPAGEVRLRQFQEKGKLVGAVSSLLTSVPVLETDAVRFGEAVTRCCADPGWSLKDRGLDALREAALAYGGLGNGPFAATFRAQNWGDMVLGALNDREPYVRAGAIDLLAVLDPDHDAWHRVDVVGQVCARLASDPEGLVRRQAAAALLRWTESRRVTFDRLHDSMRSATRDFDWEVKLNAVAFWDCAFAAHAAECRLDPATADPGEGFFDTLGRTGYFDAMAELMTDHDEAVRRSALGSLPKVRRLLAAVPPADEEPPSPALPDCGEATRTDAVSAARRDRVIEEILATDYGTLAGNMLTAERAAALSGPARPVRDVMSARDFVRLLANVGEEARCEGPYSTRALLQDVLAYRSRVPCDDNNLPDCY